MFICFPWKFTIRHLFPASPSVGDLCAEPHLINGMVCFTQTLICQREVVQLSWGKKLAAAFQRQTEVFSLKGISWGLDIFSCPVNPFSGLFILCTALTIFFYPAPCEQPSASSCSVSPVWSPTGIWAGSGMMVQAAFFSPHLQSRCRAAVLLSLKLQRKERQNYSERGDDAKYWGLVVGFFFWLQTGDFISWCQNHVS